MTTIITLLNKEKELNDLLNSKDCPNNIDQQLTELFKESFYEDTYQWFEKNKIFTLHDSVIVDFSQKKNINSYNISFKVDSLPIYSDREEIGYITNSQFKITSSQSLRDISNRIILNFLIDEPNHEIAFLFLDNNQRKTISVPYSHIEFIRGKEHFYGNKNDNSSKYGM